MAQYSGQRHNEKKIAAQRNDQRFYAAAQGLENKLLAAEGIPVRVVNVPSEGLFRDQPRSYQESVLPAGVARYGMTSGLPVNLRGLVGENGVIHGLDHFGWSAPYTVLDEKFGYNGATVAAEVKKLLGR